MKLTRRVLQIIGDTNSHKAKATRTRIALELNFTERWILKCITENKPNGPLTKAAALKVIKEDTRLNDSQILEDTRATV